MKKNRAFILAIIVLVGFIVVLLFLNYYSYQKANSTPNQYLDTPEISTETSISSTGSVTSTEYQQNDTGKEVLQAVREFLKAYYTLPGSANHFDDYGDMLSESGKTELAVPSDGEKQDGITVESGIDDLISFLSVRSNEKDTAYVVSFVSVESRTGTLSPTKACYMVVLNLSCTAGSWMIDDMPVNDLMQEDLSALFELGGNV